jgi:hypothetical protein
MDAAAAGFRGIVYTDHYYPGMAHAVILEKLFPETGVKLFSGLVLNNASGGLNPHAVDRRRKSREGNEGRISSAKLPTRGTSNYRKAF